MKITLPKTANLPVMLDHSMTDEQWIDFAKKYETLEDIIYSDKFKTKTKEQQESLMRELDDMELSICAGGVFISTPGCSMNSIIDIVFVLRERKFRTAEFGQV